MKIKKTLYSTEIDFSTEEIMDLYYKVPMPARIGLWEWIKKNFGLDLIKISPKNKSV